MTVVFQLSSDAWFEFVDPNLPGYNNRYVSPKTVDHYLEVSPDNPNGGWNEKLASTIDVAQLPDGTRVRWDGGHRVELFKKTHADGTKILAKVVKVKDYDEVSALYTARNKHKQKKLSNEDIFMHDWKKEPELVGALNNGNLSITNKAQTFGIGPSVRINGLRKALKDVGKDYLEEASIFLQDALPNQKNIPVELLHGISVVFQETKMTKNRKKKLKQYIQTLHKLKNGKINAVHTEIKTKGGRKVNKNIECTTLGLLEGMKSLGVQGLKGPIENMKAKILM